MMIMRWQLAHPGMPVPVIGPLLQSWGFSLFGNDEHGNPGMLTADGYNMLGAMHGTIMVFFGVVPVAVAAFGNYVMPLQVGAPDMAFPKLNMASYWTFFVSCVIMMSSFLVPGGAAKSGWTSYPPLSIISDSGPNVHPFWNGQTICSTSPVRFSARSIRSRPAFSCALRA
jgi:cytochrome c oxidase subunit 1